MSVETEEVVVKPLAPEQIARDRAVAAAKAPAGDIPGEAMDSAESDVIGHPSAGSGFSDMASKLEKALGEVKGKLGVTPEKDTGPAKDELKQTDSKKKPEVKAEEAKGEPEEDPSDKNITTAKAADWKALVEKAKVNAANFKELEQKHKAVTTEYEEFRKKAADLSVVEQTTKERDEIKAERDKLKETLQTAALERDEQFSSYYQSQLDEAVKKAKDAVGGSESERIEQLLALPPSKWRKEQLDVIRQDLAGIDQGQLDRALEKYDDARADRESKLKNSKAEYQKLLQVQAERAEKERASVLRRREAITDSVLKMAKEYDSFKPGDDPKGNEAVAANERFVKSFVDGTLDGPDLALMPILATEAKRYKAVVVPAMTKEIAELKATLAKFQGATPRPAGGGRTDTKNPAPGFIEHFLNEYPQGNR